MKKIIFLPLIIFITACSNETTGIESDTVNKEKTYNWRLVTSWPKNYPGFHLSRDRARGF